MLIDDRLTIKDNWIRRGGMFVHHTDTQPSTEYMKSIVAQEIFIGDTAASVTSSSLSVIKKGNGGKRRGHREIECRTLAMLKRGRVGGGEGVKKSKKIVTEGGEEEEGRKEE